MTCNFIFPRKAVKNCSSYITKVHLLISAAEFETKLNELFKRPVMLAPIPSPTCKGLVGLPE